MKKMGIAFIVIGILFVVAGTFFVLHNPGRGDAGAVAGVGVQTSGDDALSKGKAFEDYIVSLMNRNFMSLLHHSSDSKVDGIMARDDMNPDLEFELRAGGCRPTFAVECKWRSSFYAKGKVSWSNPAQMSRYRRYAEEKGIDVFVAIGVGGTPDAPNELFFVPLDKLDRPECSRAFLEKYRRPAKKQLYYDMEKHELN